jgi:acetyl esterase/lipase
MLFACVLSARAVDVSALPEGVGRVEIFLLMGQSNMVGYGKLPAAQDEYPHILNMSLANDQWIPARHPLHDKANGAGVGSGLDFAQQLVKQNSHVMVALIPLAQGGSWIDLWKVNSANYDNTIRRAKKALADFPQGTARIAGVLWLQGESDSVEGRYAVYAGKLSSLIQRLRADLNEPELPFIACTIRPDIIPKGKYLYVKEINGDLLNLPGRVPNTACVDARDLKGHNGDFMHYNTEALKIIGERYAAEYRRLTATGHSSQAARPAEIPSPAAVPGGNAPKLDPAHVRVSYGKHPAQVMDVWLVKSDKPTPVVVYIHGGSWEGGDRAGIKKYGLHSFLRAGISVVTIDYRFITPAMKACVTPPVKWPLDDAMRALQFIRSKAAEWNLDKTRIGLTGGSAGGCSSLWLAMHDDMADSKSADPIARESTRVTCAAVWDAQTSLDPKQLFEWFKAPTYGAHAFGFVKTNEGRAVSDMDACLAAREKILPWVKEYSPIEHASSDDPPVFLGYGGAPQAAGTPQLNSVHGAIFGVKLKEKMDSLGVECQIVYPVSPDDPASPLSQFLIQKLSAE